MIEPIEDEDIAAMLRHCAYRAGGAEVVIRRVREAYGWLGCMSPHPLTWEGQEYRTAEALFQARRFVDPQIRWAIRTQKSPMAAKMIARRAAREHPALAVAPRSAADVRLMDEVLRLKLDQHPALGEALLETAWGSELIVEDCTARPSESGLFWGARWDHARQAWVGTSVLGQLWMRLRRELQRAR